MSIRNQLISIYPGFSEADVAYWCEIIRTHADKKLPKTEKIEDFAELDKKIKDLTALKTELRLEIIKDYENLGSHPFEGINIAQTDNNKFDEKGFFHYMSKRLDPELMEQITKKEIDYNSLYKLEAKGVIELDELPLDLLIENPPGYRVEVAGIRGKKNEN